MYLFLENINRRKTAAVILLSNILFFIFKNTLEQTKNNMNFQLLGDWF